MILFPLTFEEPYLLIMWIRTVRIKQKDFFFRIFSLEKHWITNQQACDIDLA